MPVQNSVKIAGVTVLYHPDESFRKNIDSYIDDIDILFVIDNTESPLPQVQEQLPKNKSIYIPYHENLGIAKALNDAALLAMQQGCSFLLTMDQDSRATPGMIPHMLACLQHEDINRIGLISPYHLMSHLKEKDPAPRTCTEVLTVMTSGNLLNLSAFRAVGGFTEMLFIDAVDFDYCLRLNQNGFRVLLDSDARLIHHLGNVTTHNFFGRRVYASHHSAVRRYYITRNYLYMIRTFKSQFPAFCRSLLITVLLTPVVIILYEEDKFRKLQMILAGAFDYIRKRFGRFR